MHWNVVELAENGRYARVERGFLIVESDGMELGRVVLDELSSLVLSAEQATVSKPLLVRLAELGVPVVVCGTNYHPISISLPYSANSYSGKVLRNQIAASKPLQKRLWQQVVRQKIRNQRTALLTALENQIDGGTLKRMDRLVEKTQSGDTENCEAQASAIYWPKFFGNSFRRRQESEEFLNSALNYGYTVLRAAAARSLVAAGLQPMLGIHHRGLGNPFCLADDLMEPFRPVVDFLVWSMAQAGEKSINTTTKSKLVKALQMDVSVNGEISPVANALQQLSFSLAKSFMDKTPQLALPELRIQGKNESK